jgi:steroid 5-alpha reductase family enzyme
MLGLWILQLRTRNAAVADAGWAAAVAGLSVWAAAIGTGWPPRRAAVALLLGLWGGRLALHLLRDRVLGRPEDGRYVALIVEAGGRRSLRMCWFFQMQALAAVFFAIPAALISSNGAPAFAAIELTGLLLWLVAFAGEVTADRQLAACKRDPHRGPVCDRGLWRYSRHPNYFFEWLMWVALALVALPAPFGALALASPAGMLYLLLRVTGIPATEAHAVRSRGVAYRRYQQTTSAFVPWPPRAAPSSIVEDRR